MMANDTSQQEIEMTSPVSPDRLPRWELIGIAIGDMLALIVFAVAGRGSHGRLGVEEPIRQILNTAAPFMLGWLIASAVFGTFSGKALYPLKRLALRTIPAGLVGGVLGVVFWSLWRDNWPPAPTFFIVGPLTSTAILLAWRTLWSRVRRLWWPELP